MNRPNGLCRVGRRAGVTTEARYNSSGRARPDSDQQSHTSACPGGMAHQAITAPSFLLRNSMRRV